VQYALEMSGYDGFLNNILPREEILRARGVEPESDRRRRLFLEELQRMQHIFDQVYYEVQRDLDQMREAADRALKATAEQVEKAEQQVESIKARASRDDEGHIVYRTRDRQRGFYDDGRSMTDEQMQGVKWKEGAPTWEECQQAKQTLGEAQRAHDAAQAYSDRVDYYRERMKDGDLTLDELKDIQKDLKAMPESVSREAARMKPAPAAAASSTNLSDDFNLSASELAEIESKTAPPKFAAARPPEPQLKF